MVPFPKYIQIETSLVCNSHCVFCPHDDMERNPSVMEDAIWRKIIDESRGRSVVYRPFMVNEPFLDDRMPEIIEYIKRDETAQVEFNSNGNFVPRTDLKGLISAGMDIVRFSVDGHSEESFKESGRGGTLKKVHDDIMRFIETRNSLGAKTFIEVRMIDLEANKHEQQDYIDYWSKYADSVKITELYDWPWSGQETFHPAPCPKVKNEMFFMSDGRAAICCWDAFGKTIIGNVNEKTVEEIWLGEPLKTYKDYLSRGERGKMELCSKCDAFKNYDFSNWEGY